jgi:hypothetical protein
MYTRTQGDVECPRCHREWGEGGWRDEMNARNDDEEEAAGREQTRISQVID